MRLPPLLPLAVAAAVALAACGGDSETGTTTEGTAPSALASADASATPEVEGVPAVDVLLVSNGDTVNLREVARGNDVLFWFYAPH